MNIDLIKVTNEDILNFKDEFVFFNEVLRILKLKEKAVEGGFLFDKSLELSSIELLINLLEESKESGNLKHLADFSKYKGMMPEEVAELLIVDFYKTNFIFNSGDAVSLLENPYECVSLKQIENYIESVGKHYDLSVKLHSKDEATKNVFEIYFKMSPKERSTDYGYLIDCECENINRARFYRDYNCKSLGQVRLNELRLK